MLNENAIDTLIQPIVTRQESINTYVLSTIASKSSFDLGVNYKWDNGGAT